MHAIKRKLVSFATRYRSPLIVALTAFIISYVDPLGIEEATGDRAISTIMRLSSTQFSGSGKVTVVLIDQDYLDSQPNPSWPLSYADQGVLLRQIANQSPAAVFVDLLYKNRHRNAPGTPIVTAVDATDAGQEDVPADVLKPIQSRLDLFFFAALPKYAGARGEADEFDVASFAPGLDEHGRLQPRFENRLGLVSWSRFGDYYPLSLGRGGAMRTPAYALYEHGCTAESLRAMQLPCPQSSYRFEEPMMVRWGAFVPGHVARHIDAGVCQYTEHAKGTQLADEYPNERLRLKALAWQFVLALVDRANEASDVDSRLPCMSFAVLPASFLSDASGARNEALIREALQGRFVFVGADIPGIPDRTTSPVHGKTPGVMLHAMAMENLLTGGAGYVRATPEWFLILFKLVVLCAVAILAASYSIKDGGFLYWLFVLIGVGAWVGCAAFSFMHDNTARGMLFLIGGAFVTWFASAETGKVVLLFLLISALSLVMIELGWEPTNWIVLAVAASIVQQTSMRLTLPGSQQEPGAGSQVDNKGEREK